MDCCKYGELRRHGQYAAWEGYGYAPPYAPYAPYAHAYCPPHAHDPYARYYRYDYPAAAAASAHPHHNEHAMPMDYGAYVSKESRARRTLSRRDQRAHTAHHLPLPHTPPSECGGLSARGGGYCEPQMWPHYQMGMMGGGGGGGGWGGAHAGAWASRGMCSRDQMRYIPNDARMIKGPYLSHSSQLCPPEGRSTPYPMYEDMSHGGDSGKHNGVLEYPARTVPQAEAPRTMRECVVSSPRRSPPEEKRPPVVPLPAFQQAFGSTEIGKFAEAFSRAEAVHEVDDISNENFVYDAFQDWEGPPESQWAAPPSAREIKCEDNY
ncbi:uncharacterized protein LOC106714871 [Papilio machaon]|uniref:uncharacterized protein LOC106714871 n=1 Tax=Papilio machaon TaxID=76193 RepID=UPI001E664852|nr:uncharacterized protein LOC106714871 [Papilio machaon]